MSPELPRLDFNQIIGSTCYAGAGIKTGLEPELISIIFYGASDFHTDIPNLNSGLNSDQTSPDDRRYPNGSLMSHEPSLYTTRPKSTG